MMVKEMCQILKHGGPDDEGVYADDEQHLVLGHRRLSLIDLSNCGHQPMSYAGGRYEISFNGEIYNYKELKSELQRAGACFKTNSDTEVILAAFATWGTASFDRLNGMFAFALFDKENKKLYLVRDPSGIKPLYYAATKEGLAFASEIRGFKPIPYLQEENDLWPVYLMAYGFLPEPVTTLKKVRPVAKGAYVCYDVKTNSCKTFFYKIYQYAEELGNREEVVEKIKDTLTQAVKRNLIADAPLGVFLSGGIDSGIIALLASKSSDTDLNTLSIYFNDKRFSEKKYQDILLDKLGVQHNQFLLSEAEFHKSLPDVFDSMDQPGSDGINTWFISKYAHQNGLKAVLSGIGADELYGGYPSFDRIHKVLVLEKFPNRLLNAGKYTSLRKLRRVGYLSLGGATGKYLFLRGQFIPAEIATHLNMDEAEVWDILQDVPKYDNISILSPENQASWMETNIYMQNQLLRDADTMSMAHGVEIRVPFLDTGFVNLAVKIKSIVKYGGQRNKQLLIDTFKDVLPEPIWNRTKMGFSFPFKEWFSKNEFVKDCIDSDRIYQKFISGNLHWTQYLTLALLKTHQIEPESSLSYT
jgi:asparagine synthase (glutamine-hydrolysing)